jgi:hypothetical protein
MWLPLPGVAFAADSVVQVPALELPPSRFMSAEALAMLKRRADMRPPSRSS